MREAARVQLMDESIPTKSHLERLVTTHARDTGIAVARIRRWISTMVLLGALDRVRGEDNQHRFVLKGGVAMELRLGVAARVTNDVDATFYGNRIALQAALTTAFAAPVSGFTFETTEPGANRQNRCATVRHPHQVSRQALGNDRRRAGCC